MATAPTVLVAGGGLAGLCAAVLLAREGYGVTLLEQRGFLGGRTHALTDRATGATIDNGQHVLLAGYRATRAYLEAIGTARHLHFPAALETLFRDPRVGAVWLRAPRLPGAYARAAPLVAMLGLANVPLRERLPSARAVRELLGLVRGVPDALDEITADAWLSRMGVPASLRRAFWDPFVISTLNEKPERVSAHLLATVLHWGFLGDPANARLGYPTTDLTSLFVTPALKLLAEPGARVRTAVPVRALALADGRVTAVHTEGGERLAADAYVLALPPDALTRVLRGSALADHAFFARAARIRSAPIVAVNYWLDGPLGTTHPYEGLLDCAIEWVFDRARMGCAPAGPGHYYALIVSAAWQLEGLPQSALLAAAMDSLRLHYPRVRERAVLGASVVRHPRATFSAAPGFNALRCPQATPVANLFLAGDWTDTGLPSTMESAAESAFRAVNALRAAVGAATR
jgi:squalene-associated FAD-dependent desaturase